MHNFEAISRAILDGYALPWRGAHGVLHWARVWTNGLKVAEVNGADQEIVKLFALFHDSRRVNEYTDPGHGERGGDFARELRGTLVHLDDDRFELLYEACRLHTDGLTDGDPTEQACWDAERVARTSPPRNARPTSGMRRERAPSTTIATARPSRSVATRPSGEPPLREPGLDRPLV